MDLQTVIIFIAFDLYLYKIRQLFCLYTLTCGMGSPFLDDLCKEMPQLSLTVDSEFNTTKKERVESDESDDDSPSYQVTPHYESISSDEESYTSSIYPPKLKVPFPWEVSLSFAPGYLRTNLNFWRWFM